MMSPKRFAFELGFKLGRLKRICEKIDSYYTQGRILKTYDDGSPKRLKNGEYDYRTITKSSGVLKVVQKQIKEQYLDVLTWPEYVHGGIRGHNNRSNAKSHMGKDYHFVTDIRDFFPSIRHTRVYDAFINKGFSPDAARLITQLTTYNGSLPQGTPTSPHIANLVFLAVDSRIVELCSRESIVYTRYVDDLVFSSQLDFQHLTGAIIEIIGDTGYRISNTTKTYYKIGPVEITGIVTKKNVLRAPKRKKEKLARLDPASSSYAGLAGYIDYVESNY